MSGDEYGDGKLEKWMMMVIYFIALRSLFFKIISVAIAKTL